MNPFFLSESGSPQHLGFAHFEFDRAAHLREDPAGLDALFARPDCRVLALAGEQVLLRNETPLDPLFRTQDLPDDPAWRERAFIGLEHGAPRFAVAYGSQAAETLGQRTGISLVGLRQLAVETLLSPSALGALACAKALLFWHSRRRFCSVCGQPSKATQGGWRRDCPSCNAQFFPRTDPVVIMLAVRGEHCLMGRQKQFIPGMYSALAGFCEPGETIEDAMRREILEEAGIRVGRVRYLASQPWPFPASLMIGGLAEAVSETILRDETELEDARWFSREEVRQMLRRQHPDNLWVPMKFSLASQLVRAWAEGGAEF
ncbi:MAG TPA: NAD(+) diphosphatase [Beijerinckiaceae bacterium]|nr:NAD(+) diphosphatase [Beijerinckiaceae bacterium]